jgi:hypothetical protein
MHMRGMPDVRAHGDYHLLSYIPLHVGETARAHGVDMKEGAATGAGYDILSPPPPLTYLMTI